IAELQANLETEMIVTRSIESLPLSKDSRIIHGNALETDWATVLAPENCDYIIGNPPFLGARNQSPAQKAEVREAFTAIGATRNLGNIDYVGAWFATAARYMGDHPVRTAFVATNSVCQGEQVANIWHPIHELGFHIDFGHNNFRWGNGAKDPAHVFCVIVGFSKQGVPKTLFHYPTVDSEPEVRSVKKLNPYLEEADNIFVWTRSTPICDVPSIGIGSQLIDFGHYTFTPQEKADFLEKEPQAEKYFYRLSGGREFLNGIERWVLWLGEITLQDLQQMPMVRERIEAVRERRSSVKRRQTREAANTPHRFGMEVIPEGNSLIVPQTSSERRRYIPLGFTGKGTLYTQKTMLIPGATLYQFGILHSRVHNAWMRAVGGRMKSDYSYTVQIVYNNFIWPDVSHGQEREIAEHAQVVLDAREFYEDATIAQMYDPDYDWLYPELTAAHHALDAAVEQAYGLEPGCDEKIMVERLFQLYAKTIKRLS